jgi:hypothetical protein
MALEHKCLYGQALIGKFFIRRFRLVPPLPLGTHLIRHGHLTQMDPSQKLAPLVVAPLLPHGVAAVPCFLWCGGCKRVQK